MSREELVNLIKAKPYLMRMGSGKLSRRYHCTVDDIKWAKREVSRPASLPKILVLDLEMAPLRAYVWRRWKENISLDQTISDTFVLCWSAKWLFSDTIESAWLTPEEISHEDDKRIMFKLWSLLDEADMAFSQATVQCAIDIEESIPLSEEQEGTDRETDIII